MRKNEHFRVSRRSALIGLAATAALPQTAFAASKHSIVATTGMIADAARRVGGDLVEVRALMGPGVDPHAYRQTRTDILAMTRADLVLRHGLYLEAQMADFMARLGARKPVIAVGEAVPREKLLAHDDYEDKFDPHLWMDPTLWRDVVSAIRDAMIAAFPAEAERFDANAVAYLGELDALATYAGEVLASVAAERRVLVTAHDAFNYFGAAYDFEVVGIQGISTESEAGLNRVGALVKMLVEREIGAVFVESSVSDRNIRALIEGAASRDHEVRIGGELYSDAMGPDGSYEGSYLGMIDHNVTTIARALGGTAPERGRLDRLAAI